MKIIRYNYQGEIFYGKLEGRVIKPLRGNIFEEFEVTDNKIELEKVKVLPPCKPGKIVGIGLNYHDTAEKMNLVKPDEPIIFLKAPTTVIGPDDDIIFPSWINELAYEVELAVIIGRKGRNILSKDALDYVLGYTAANDITVRDYMKPGKPWAAAKSLDTSTPLGPVIETDILPDDLNLKLYVNDILKQDGSTKDMIFNVEQIISFVSTIMTLEPGDVILSGTPYGGGLLNRGDIVKIEVEGIGQVLNRVL